MGMLVDGQWQDVWYETKKTGGRFVRSSTQFRNWITSDGSPGPTGKGGFAAEAGRYHLYASYACPWVHRVLIYRAIKGLESMIDVSFVDWYMGENGWTFSKAHDDVVGDHLFNLDFAHQLYTKAVPDYTGRVTVPIIWDKETNTIVSNESSEIIRMLNSEFDGLDVEEGDYYPIEKRFEIDELNNVIYDAVNNGVYKAGFATSQEAYDEGVEPLFATMDWLDKKLAEKRYLTGEKPTEADWRLFTTLFRFDPIYFIHFKCSKKRLADYEHLWPYARDLYQLPGVAGTTNLTHAIHHYYESHKTINPHGIVPDVTLPDWQSPHNRG